MKFLVILQCMFVMCYSWRHYFNRVSVPRSKMPVSSLHRLMSSVTSDVEPPSMLSSPAESDALPLEPELSSKEEVFKVYPFTNLSLPQLMTCNDYWSGKFGDYIWHQNRDHVNAFVPIDESVSKSDVSVSIEQFNVSVSVGGQQVVHFVCPYAINPSSSFWVLERDINDKKYIQLDLEKRVGYINWMNLFQYKKPATSGSSAMTDPHKAMMLEKLFAANKGLAKLTNSDDPQSIEAMLHDPELMNRIASVDEIPKDRDISVFQKKGEEMSIVPRDKATGEIMTVDMFKDKEKKD